MSQETLKQRLDTDMKESMRAKDKERLGTVRLILAAIKQREVDERIMLDDVQVLAVLEKMVKQRRDSITQFEAAGRTDLAAKEKYELDLIQSYMPAQLSEAEIDAIIEQTIAATGASSAKDMGKVMGPLKAQLLLVVLRTLFHQLVQRLRRRAAGGTFAALPRYAQAGAGGQFFHCLDEVEVLILHQEAECGAVGAAAEAVIELLALADRERRRLFVVERAAGDVFPALFPQRHARIDHVDDIDAAD